MNKLAIIAAIPALALAACNTPEGEDTADLGADATTADVGGDEVAGDGNAPELENVQAALDEACPTLRNEPSEAVCEATELGTEFTCTYRFGTDEEGTERELTLTRGEDGADWDVKTDPEFCEAFDRGEMRAEAGSDTATESTGAAE